VEALSETREASRVTNSKIRVGIVGASPNRGFASIAHIPALQALADFEISAVCTLRVLVGKQEELDC
jgi:hypothetical protein